MRIFIVIIATIAIAIAAALLSAPAAYAAGEPGAPVNMSVSKLGTGNLSFEWELGSGAINTTVVSKVGSWPTDRDDGSTLYKGNGTAFEDGPYNLDYDTLYVRAWSDNASVYSLEYAEVSIGGDFMQIALLFIFVALAAVLLIVGVTQKFRWISAASAVPWALTAYFAYQQYSADGSLLWEMFALFGLVMFVVAGAVSIGIGGGDGEDSTGQGVDPGYITTRKKLAKRLGDE